ncbi:hypothetical protein KEM55_005360, partial [Ascosphaera atra]
TSPYTYHLGNDVASLYTFTHTKHEVMSVHRKNPIPGLECAEVLRTCREKVGEDQSKKGQKSVFVTQLHPKFLNLSTNLDAGETPPPKSITEDVRHAMMQEDCRVVRQSGSSHYDIYHRNFSGRLPTMADLRDAYQRTKYEPDMPHLRVRVSCKKITVSIGAGFQEYCTAGWPKPLITFDLETLDFRVHANNIESKIMTPCALDTLVSCVLIIAITDKYTESHLRHLPYPQPLHDLEPEHLPTFNVLPRKANISALDCAINMQNVFKSLGIPPHGTSRQTPPGEGCPCSAKPPRARLSVSSWKTIQSAVIAGSPQDLNMPAGPKTGSTTAAETIETPDAKMSELPPMTSTTSLKLHHSDETAVAPDLRQTISAPLPSGKDLHQEQQSAEHTKRKRNVLKQVLKQTLKALV